MSLHAYLENNKGSDADFDKVDALLDQLSAKSKDKAAFTWIDKSYSDLESRNQVKINANEEATPATNAEANDDKTSTETETSVAAESTVKLPATKTNQATQEILNLLNQLQKRKQLNLQQSTGNQEKTSRIKVGR